MTDLNSFILPLINKHYERGDVPGTMTLGLETIGGKFATRLTPIDAADLAGHLLQWSSRNPDPGGLSVTSSPVKIDVLSFEASELPGHIRLRLDAGSSSLQFELPAEQLIAEINEILRAGHG